MKSDPIANPALKDFWLTDARFRILYGGRDSSKSWDAAIRAVWIAHRIKVRFLCTRMYQNRIEESVYTLLKKQIHRLKLPGYRILRNKIINEITGSEFLFYGLARNIEEIKSLEGVDIAWLEEAHAITGEMWEILEPTIRKEHSEFWVVMNPQLRTDFAYQRFIENPPEGAVVRKINYDENPFLSDTSKQTIERIKGEDYSAYEHIYLGYPKKDDDDAIIKRAWIEACVDAHEKLGIDVSGAKTIGYDPADAGEDKNAMTYRHGNLVLDTSQWDGGEDQLYKSTERVYNAAMPGFHVNYDSVGIGAGVGSNFNQMGGKVTYSPFNAGGKVVNPDKEYKYGVKNKDHFSNLKAQTWWIVADRMMETYNAVTKGQGVDPADILSISGKCSNLQALITELSTPKKDYDGKGRVKVESKKDLAKRGVDSPNLADSFVMSFSPILPKTTLKPRMITI